MKYLLDVSVLVAWGWSDHIEHKRVVRWIATARQQAAAVLLTSAIPQLGFVRVSVQRTRGCVTIDEASAVLAGLVGSLGDRHEFLADDLPAGEFPTWCQSEARTTDAHLCQLAEAHAAELATLDGGIPGAFLIPLLGKTR
jgi:predicted nucleic acid-binding protein